MIKIKLPFKYKCFDGETVWVKPLGNNIGEISNLPLFATRYKYKDLVKFDPKTWKVREKIADGGYTRTKVCEYTGNFFEEKAYWESKGYIVEGLAPGALGISRKRKRSKVVTNYSQKLYKIETKVREHPEFIYENSAKSRKKKRNIK